MPSVTVDAMPAWKIVATATTATAAVAHLANVRILHDGRLGSCMG